MLYKFERRHKQGIAQSLCDITEGLISRTARRKRTFPISKGSSGVDRVEMHIMTIILVMRNHCSGDF